MSLIPIISFGNKDKTLLSKELFNYSKEFGFFYIKDHGIDISLLNQVESFTKRYFELPQSIKDQFRINPKNEEKFGYFSVGQQKGYSSTKGVDYKEGCYLVDESQIKFKNHQRIFLNEEEEKQFDVVGFKQTIELYNSKLLELCNFILELVSISLNLPNDYFSTKYSNPSSYLGIFKYPSFKGNQEMIDNFGMKAHSDFGFITLLYQDNIGGLQVLVGDKFIDVTPIQGTLVCNFGDILQAVTNGVYKSNIHRVLLNVSDHSRYSLGYFFSPPWNIPIANVINKTQDQTKNEDSKNLNGVTHLEYFKKQMKDFFR